MLLYFEILKQEIKQCLTLALRSQGCIFYLIFEGASERIFTINFQLISDTFLSQLGWDSNLGYISLIFLLHVSHIMLLDFRSVQTEWTFSINSSSITRVLPTIPQYERLSMLRTNTSSKSTSYLEGDIYVLLYHSMGYGYVQPTTCVKLNVAAHFKPKVFTFLISIGFSEVYLAFSKMCNL